MPDTTDNARLVEMEAALSRALEAETCAKETLSRVVRELHQAQKVAEVRQTALASANALNERLVALVRKGTPLQWAAQEWGTREAEAWEAEARALLADMGKGDGG